MTRFLTVLSTIFLAQALNPDFEIATPEGRQVFREELAIALTKTPGANAQTRDQFKRRADALAARLFREGQRKLKLKQDKTLTVLWDFLDPHEVAKSHHDIEHEPFEVFKSHGEHGLYRIHLNEIMFFSYFEEHMKFVIPHEVAHHLLFQKWDNPDFEHGSHFIWTVWSIAPHYRNIDLDITPACRLSRRLMNANRIVSFDPACDR